MEERLDTDTKILISPFTIHLENEIAQLYEAVSLLRQRKS